MKEIFESAKSEAQITIHTASAGAAAIGGGLAFFPFADNVPLMGIQMGMAIRLGKLFGIDLSESMASGAVRTVLASMSGQFFTRSLSQAILGWVPVWGNALNATTAAIITEAVGWSLFQKFSEQKNTLKGQQPSAV